MNKGSVALTVEEYNALMRKLWAMEDAVSVTERWQGSPQVQIRLEPFKGLIKQRLAEALPALSKQVDVVIESSTYVYGDHFFKAVENSELRAASAENGGA